MNIKNFSTLVLTSLVFCLFSAAYVAARGGLLITVNNAGDSVDAVPGDLVCADSAGQCTLRAAIDEANANSEFNAIIFDLPNPSAIDLTLGELSIRKSFDIVGPGARRLTVRRSSAPGTPNFRIFRIAAGQTTINIRGLTIRNGRHDDAGGGLFVEAGSILSLTDVAVSANQADLGGGIANFGTLKIVRSLINSNLADSLGGGILNAVVSADTTITSSTLTDNSADVAGAIHNQGIMLLVNDTISRNSASLTSSGIVNAPDGIAKVLNTIIGRDMSPPMPTIQGAFQSLGNNIVTDSRGSTGFTNGVNGDQVSENNVIDPLLGNLADNGGETDTLALQPGSPAINNGNACATRGPCPQLPGVFFRNSLDQRRFHRLPFASSIDIGAFAANTATVSPGASYSLSFSGLGQGARHYNSRVTIINATTLEKHYTMLKLGGVFSFRNLPLAAVYVVEIKSKRSGIETPFVFPLD